MYTNEKENGMVGFTGKDRKQQKEKTKNTMRKQGRVN
jgi:hypothetical protein